MVERTAAGRMRVWRMLRVRRRGARDAIVVVICYRKQKIGKQFFEEEECGDMLDQRHKVRFATADGPRHLPNSSIAERLASGEEEAAQFRSPFTCIHEHLHRHLPFKAHQRPSCACHCILPHPVPPGTYSRHYTLQPSPSTQQPWYLQARP